VVPADVLLDSRIHVVNFQTNGKIPISLRYQRIPCTNVGTLISFFLTVLVYEMLQPEFRHFRTFDGITEKPSIRVFIYLVKVILKKIRIVRRNDL